jgi:hypothetical protein
VTTAQVDVRIQVESHEVAGWHPRDRKDFEALLDQEMHFAYDLQLRQGSDWGADLTRSGDRGLESELLHLLGLLRKHAPRDVRVAVIHNRRWVIDPFGPLTVDAVYAPPTFAPDNRPFGTEIDEIYGVIEIRSQELRTRTDSEDLLLALSAFAHPTFDTHPGVGEQYPCLLMSEESPDLSAQLVRIAEFFTTAGFPADTRLHVWMERSWWIEVFQ